MIWDVTCPGCEDIIAEALTIDSLPSILQWSSKPHGSVWVHRQAVQFLREEFSQLVQPCHLPVLYELSRDYLVDAVSSDFLQVGPVCSLGARCIPRPVASAASVIGWATRPVLILATGLEFATRPRCLHWPVVWFSPDRPAFSWAQLTPTC